MRIVCSNNIGTKFQSSKLNQRRKKNLGKKK